jgi:riboflavin transporter FmnP
VCCLGVSSEKKERLKMSLNTNALPEKKKYISISTMAKIGVLGALAAILMLVEIPLWFAPPFYKIDLSEVPVLIGALAMGPVAGILIELIKILGNFLLNGTATYGVGELANFLIGISLVLPPAIMYKKKKTRLTAGIGLAIGTVFMSIIGALLNAFVLLPVYANVFSMSLDNLVAMGTAVNGNIKSITGFVLLAVTPFNLLKGIIVSVCTLLLYKYLSPLLKNKY